MDFAAVRKSVYDVLKLESFDLKTKVIGLEYYEDLFSPIITMKLKIINSGDPILPLVGGERLVVKILKNSKTNTDLDFSKNPNDYFHVTSVTDVIKETGKESFTLHLSQKESIANELSRVVKKYPKELNIHDSVKKILTEVLQTNKINKIDKTSNKYGFIGNMRKPFTVLLWLASKSVPVKSKDGTAGFLFYQTKEGFNFKEEPKATYTYTQGNESYDNNNVKVNNDFKILNFHANRNQNLIEKLRLGSFASSRMFFNPLDFKFTDPEKGLFKESDYKNKVDTLNNKSSTPVIPPGALELTTTSLQTRQNGGSSVSQSFYGRGRNPEIDLSNTPSRLITQILDLGTTDKEVSTDFNSEPEKYQSQSLMRYNLLFNTELYLIVPLNSNLCAGHNIICNFPKSTTSNKSEDDEEISGLYMIKELCHHYDSENSYTTMKLIRET